MKTKLIILIILACAQVAHATNDTIKMLDTTNVWVVRARNHMCYPIPPYTGYSYCGYREYIKAQPDTVINNFQYFKFKTFYWQDTDPNYYETWGGGANRNWQTIYRQEGKKILYRYKSDTDTILLQPAEQVLYDFSLGIGDSLVMNYGGWGSEGFQYYKYVLNIVDTSSIVIENIRYKVQQVRLYNMFNDILIEGIGSMVYPDINAVPNGGQGYGWNLVEGEHYWELHCFKRNDVPIALPYYGQRLEGACASNMLSIDEFPSSIPFNFINIYPNPASQYIQLQSPQAIQQIEIYNTQGKIVMQESIINTTTLNIAHLNSGVYICRALTAKGWISNKFIKQ